MNDFNGPTFIHYAVPPVCIVSATQFDGFTSGLLCFSAGMGFCLLLAWNFGWRKTNTHNQEPKAD